MKQGKLTNQDLNRLVLDRLGRQRPEVVLGAGIGEDCAALDLKGDLCVLSTDPITAAAKNQGSLAVHVSANDVASAGAEPVGLLVTLLIPPSSTWEEVEQVVEELTKTASSLNLDVIGGHTEVTNAVSRLVVSTTVIGRAPKKGLVRSAGAKEGDALLITKWAGIEGTSIILNDFPHLAADILTTEELEEAHRLERGISVVAEGRIAAKLGATAMHDVTEGGVLGAVHELATAAGLGAKIDFARIPIATCTQKLCRRLGLDPLRLLSSGSMLIAIAANLAEELQAALEKEGIPSAMIGHLSRGRIETLDGREISPPQADEIYKLPE